MLTKIKTGALIALFRHGQFWNIWRCATATRSFGDKLPKVFPIVTLAPWISGKVSLPKNGLNRRECPAG
jgi:hypothetical protein